MKTCTHVAIVALLTFYPKKQQQNAIRRLKASLEDCQATRDANAVEYNRLKQQLLDEQLVRADVAMTQLDAERAARQLKEREYAQAQRNSEGDEVAASKEHDKLKGKLDAVAAQLLAVKGKIEAFQQRADKTALQALPKPPRSYCEAEFEALAYNGKASARHRIIKYAEQIFGDGSFRPEDIATFFTRQDLLEGVWESKEV
eukprot:3065382-Pleurochrysis_carterae.AAC.1